MSKRLAWIDKALDELGCIEEMALGACRTLNRPTDGAIQEAHFIASIIETHGQDAKRYLSYAARCKEATDE